MKKNATAATVATVVLISGEARGVKFGKSEGLGFWGA